MKVENDLEVEVECTQVVKLFLEPDFEIFLENTFYVSSLRRNLISIFSIHRLRFSFDFHNEKVKLIFNSQIVDYGILNDRIYKLYLDCNNPYTFLNVENVVAKRSS